MPVLYSRNEKDPDYDKWVFQPKSGIGYFSAPKNRVADPEPPAGKRSRSGSATLPKQPSSQNSVRRDQKEYGTYAIMKQSLTQEHDRENFKPV